MYNTIKELMNGNEKVTEYYSEAMKIWKTINIVDKDLSTILFNNQLEFEHRCGGRNLGQEIMVYSGIVQYVCDDMSNTESAKKIADAFIKSNCSIEVKQFAKDAKEYLNL